MSDRATGSGPRYHALDCARATAMLLGVLYHAVRAGMMRGGGWGQGGSPGASRCQTWFFVFDRPGRFAVSDLVLCFRSPRPAPGFCCLWRFAMSDLVLRFRSPRPWRFAVSGASRCQIP
jgi:hypothetical protein